METNMYCTTCGGALEGSEKYCSQCGTSTGSRFTMPASGPAPRLTRSTYDTKIGGVCGGLAQYLVVDSTLVRLVWLIATICFPPLLIALIGTWIMGTKDTARFES